MIPGVAGGGGFTAIVISLLVTGVGLTQVAFEVITTVTLSPFTNELLVKVLLLLPTLLPFSFH
jgi:hypothetical protein